MKKILFLLTFTFAFLFNSANAEKFDITNYNIYLNVKQDNSIEIVENIDTYFKQSAHGIFREIPLVNEIKTVHDGNYKRQATIEKVSTIPQSSKFESNGNVIIKLGNPNTLVKGNQSYKINYTYRLDNDKLKGKDEFYFNIIGTNWNTTIEKVTFSIVMPKNIKPESVGFSVGKSGTIGYNDKSLIYKIQDNIISGSTTRALKPNEAITVRIELPEGYFKKADTINLKEKINVIFFSILLTLVCYLIWFAYGKDDTVIPVVNFYPPKGINSAELGVLYDHDGKASPKSIVSLIVYLASKGYVKINMPKIGKDFTITKLKEYDGKNNIERILFNALFPDDAKTQFTTYLDLKFSRIFYLVCQELIEELNEIRKKMFEQDSISWKTLLLPILCAIGLFVILLYTLFGFSFNFISHSFILPFPMVGFAVLFKFLSSKAKMSDIIFILIWFCIFAGVPTIIMLQEANLTLDNFLIALVPLACLLISLICIRELPKRNKTALKLLGHILGFKKFIEVAEINKIKSLIKTNPTYGYDILPFAYILDVDATWLSKLEGITNPPDWYNGNYRTFGEFTNCLNEVSKPSTANGGVSSSSSHGGGGHSGGGSGGGGGGSW